LRESVEALLGSWKIQRIATVGGNICLALPAGPMTSLAAGLGATGLVWGPGEADRRLAVADLVTGPVENSLAPGEVLRAIEFPAPPTWTVMRRASLIPMGRSGVFVVARLDAGGDEADGAGVVEPAAGEPGATGAAVRFRVTVTAAVPAPRVLEFAGVPSASDLAAAVDAIDPWLDDPHGAPDWRHALTRRFAEELRADAERHLSREGA
jgi:CO/xanthine dehydrogenase FAD-binding subunit